MNHRLKITGKERNELVKKLPIKEVTPIVSNYNPNHTEKINFHFKEHEGKMIQIMDYKDGRPVFVTKEVKEWVKSNLRETIVKKKREIIDKFILFEVKQGIVEVEFNKIEQGDEFIVERDNEKSLFKLHLKNGCSTNWDEKKKDVNQYVSKCLNVDRIVFQQ